MSPIASSYPSYVESLIGFRDFHNEVINMPRDAFSNTGIEKIRTIAGYLLLCQGILGNTGATYKTIMGAIHSSLNSNAFPQKRDIELEDRYFRFNDLDTNYEIEGRMFRHWMAMCKFFGLLRTYSSREAVIVYEKCSEYYLSDNKALVPVARNNLLNLNAGDNDFLLSLRGPQITQKTNYRPAHAILRYIAEIGRGVTSFELATLLGRVDGIQEEAEIISRALEVGKSLPNRMEQQIPYFFAQMGWRHDNGVLFSYAASQEPHFKFNSFLLFMRSFGLIRFDEHSQLFWNTEYAQEILSDDISYALADLEKLLNYIDDDDQTDAELRDIILVQRNPQLLDLIRTTDDFYRRMNKRSLRNPIIINNKRRRNQLIAELAKLKSNYICQYSGEPSFQTPLGKPYCEAHHIIEFGSENGPDITSNLVVLGPEPHKAIHLGSTKVKEDVYVKLLESEAINYDMFKEMVEDYACLTRSHVVILFSRHLITIAQKQELLELLNQQNDTEDSLSRQGMI